MKISVLTPSFNSVKYIERAIVSVCKQDYKNWEHIVLDGGSTDGTIDVLNKYPHLIWQSMADEGQSDAMNKAFDRASGDIIFYLNVDDEFEDGIFSSMVNEFKKSDVDMIVGNLRINHLGEIVIRKPSISLPTVLNYWPAKFPINPVSYAYKRNLQKKIGPFPLENHYTMDYWFILRAYLLGKILKKEILCGTYYADGNNKSSDSTRSRKELKSVRDHFVKTYFFRLPVLVFLGREIFRQIFNRLAGKSNRVKK